MDKIANTTPDVTALVLCGGRARRLGGVDKGLHPVLGRPLVEYVIERIEPQVMTLILNANRNIPYYENYGYRVVGDRNRDFDGPLAGVLAGLRSCRTDWLVSVPCDAPCVARDLVVKLLDAAQMQDAEIACAFDGTRLQPTFSLYRTTLTAPLAEYLDQGERKIDRFFERRRFVKSDFSGQSGDFVNLNSDDDVARFTASLMV
ncbi:MAG: molybdenum cofactor guanylyltransferase [marine bacterium B5-7]|nr:MAG: molybdenum cofactor guanylyltransferase [marine bacterium B5-7]